MHQPDMFQVIQAAAAGGHFGSHPLADAPLFAERRAERSDDIEIADDVDQFSVHRGGLPRILAVALCPLPGQIENESHPARAQSPAMCRPGPG